MRAAALLLVLGAAACASRPQPVITGFRGVAWGASETEVIARLGRPWHRLERSESEAYLAYGAVMLADYASEPSVIVDRDSGLVQGGYVVRIRRFERGCEAAFDSVSAVLLAEYPSLRPRRQLRNPGNLPFCRAVMEGRADASMRLEDPANGAMLLAALERGRDFLRVTYASPLAVRRARGPMPGTPAADLPQAMR